MAKRKNRRKVKKKPFAVRKQSHRDFSLPKISEEQVFERLFGSDVLVEEPEFRDALIFDSFEVIDTFQMVSDELTVAVPIEQLDGDELAEYQDNLYKEILKRLATKEKQQEVRDKLHALHERLIREGRKDDSLTTATIGAFMDSLPSVDGWQYIGLVRALLSRHLEALMVLSDAMESVEDQVGEIDSFESLGDLLDAARQEKVSAKASGILGKIPGLSRMLEKSVDKIWNEGYDAIRNGELTLGLFSDEEKRQLFERFAEVSGEIALDSEEGAKIFLKLMFTHVNSFRTPERLSEMQKIVEKEAANKRNRHWQPFLYLLKDDFKDEEWLQDGVQNFLVNALFGEMRPSSETADE